MKTGYLITARLKSTRLKRKILLDIDGETILDKVIRRCLAVKCVDEVILCTSTNAEDAELQNVAIKHNIKFFRGHEDDVLQRLLDAARKENIDRFISITADNPLHSILAAETILDFDNENCFDFIFTKNLPMGVAPYFIRTDALDVSVYMKKASDTEIWGPFVNQPSFFYIGNLSVINNPLPSDLRITCDYEADYNFIKKLYQSLQSVGFPDLHEIISAYKSTPSLFEINKGIIQRMPDKETIAQINSVFNLQIQEGYEYAIGKNIVLRSGTIEKSIRL